MTLLDKIPDSTWFFCFPLWLGVFCIATLGIIHPLFWISVMRIYRSEVFVFMYVLVGFWSVLSIALLYAILMESSCIYVFWIYYTIVFAITMMGMMFLLFCGFCVLGMRRKSICAIIGLVYYLVTLYFVVVVNMQRKSVFRQHADSCGDCDSLRTSAPRFHELQDIPDETTTLEPFEPLKTSRTVDYTTTTMPQALIPAITDTKTMASTIRAIDTAMRTVAMAAPLARAPADDETNGSEYSKATHNWVMDSIRRDMEVEEPKTLPSTDVDRLAAIARLSELLVNSNECRKPRKPAHGRFELSKRSTTAGGSTLRVTLRCDTGYRENSVETECKNNWWDRPMPQCRKRRQPPPLPPDGGGCVMPDYPEHGEYRVSDHARARPGDRVTGDNVILLVTCDAPFRAVDSYVICVEGRWRHAPPSCRHHCKLVFDSTVEYKCFKAFKDDFQACGSWQPDGTSVVAACRPGHAHRGPFKYMRCRGEAWDHVVSCLPNANFTK